MSGKKTKQKNKSIWLVEKDHTPRFKKKNGGYTRVWEVCEGTCKSLTKCLDGK